MREPKKGKPEKGKNLVRIVNANPAVYAKALADAQERDPSGAAALEIVKGGFGTVHSIPDCPPVLRVQVRGKATMITAQDSTLVAQMKADDSPKDIIQAFIKEQAARRRAKEKTAPASGAPLQVKADMKKLAHTQNVAFREWAKTYPSGKRDKGHIPRQAIALFVIEKLRLPKGTKEHETVRDRLYKIEI